MRDLTVEQYHTWYDLTGMDQHSPNQEGTYQVNDLQNLMDDATRKKARTQQHAYHCSFIVNASTILLHINVLHKTGCTTTRVMNGHIYHSRPCLEKLETDTNHTVLHIKPML